jgi:hypothetical protein
MYTHGSIVYFWERHGNGNECAALAANRASRESLATFKKSDAVSDKNVSFILQGVV